MLHKHNTMTHTAYKKKRTLYIFTCNSMSFVPSPCIDVDECAGTHGCQDTCTNTLGSFMCDCLEGYMLDSDGNSCEYTRCMCI